MDGGSEFDSETDWLVCKYRAIFFLGKFDGPFNSYISEIVKDEMDATYFLCSITSRLVHCARFHFPFSVLGLDPFISVF